MPTSSSHTLTNRISSEDFLSRYWLKKELVEFCRRNGLSTMGAKLEIQERIAHFLETGKKESTNLKKSSSEKSLTKTQLLHLDLDSKIPVGFRCTREARDFFISHIGPNFHYSVVLQEYIKNHPGITFRDVIREHDRLIALKKSGLLKPEIGKQFEYNQFTRDFFSDPANKDKTREDCIKAWNLAKSTSGNRKYQRVR